MFDKEKRSKIAAYLLENPTASIREAAAIFGVTYQQAYVVSRAERGPMRKKKPAVKAKSKMGKKKVVAKKVVAKKVVAEKDAPKAITIEMLEALCEEMPKSIPDMVNQPPHYTKGGIETIDFIEAKELNYNLGNVVKYVTRSGLKGTRIEDLKKAKWYLEREIGSLLGD
jgi:transposase